MENKSCLLYTSAADHRITDSDICFDAVTDPDALAAHRRIWDVVQDRLRPLCFPLRSDCQRDDRIAR